MDLVGLGVVWVAVALVAAREGVRLGTAAGRRRAWRTAGPPPRTSASAQGVGLTQEGALLAAASAALTAGLAAVPPRGSPGDGWALACTVEEILRGAGSDGPGRPLPVPVRRPLEMAMRRAGRGEVVRLPAGDAPWVQADEDALVVALTGILRGRPTGAGVGVRLTRAGVQVALPVTQVPTLDTEVARRLLAGFEAELVERGDGVTVTLTAADGPGHA